MRLSTIARKFGMDVRERRADEIEQAPIVKAVDGKPPEFVVACLDCDFAHDAHGATADDAVKAVAPTHQPGHRLTAVAQDLSDHPLYT